MRSWKSLKKELLKDPGVTKEYKMLVPRYAVIAQLIEKRVQKGLTQKELARKIGTKQSAVARLESGNANPTIDFLSKISRALGAPLTIQIG